ncbi:MAG: hypothetical protein ABIW50_06100 [Candidatus Limnocylindria bacterium]
MTVADAEIAAELWHTGTALSLGDRLCLALGVRMNAVVATADEAWVAVPVGPKVALIR